MKILAAGYAKPRTATEVLLKGTHRRFVVYQITEKGIAALYHSTQTP